MKQKLMEVMCQRNSIYKLKGDIQIDDAYLGGEQPGENRTRSGEMAPFVVAVQTREDSRSSQLRRVAGFTREAIKDYAAASVEGWRLRRTTGSPAERLDDAG